MKKRSFPWHLLALVLLIAAAFASAAFAVKPLVYNAEKTQEIKRENRQFYLNAEALKEIAEEAEQPMPYESLYRALQTYNRWLVEIRQGNLDTKRSMEIVRTFASELRQGEMDGIRNLPALLMKRLQQNCG